MQNSQLQANAIFTDAHVDSLLEEGSTLVRDALERLGFRVLDEYEVPKQAQAVRQDSRLTAAYLLVPPGVRFCLLFPPIRTCYKFLMIIC